MHPPESDARLPEGRANRLAQAQRDETGLTKRLRQACDRYLADPKRRWGTALREAGFSENVATRKAAAYWRIPAVQTYINAEMAEIARRNHLDQDWVVQQYKAVAGANLRDVLEWGPDGVKLRPSAELPPEVVAAVAEVRETDAGIAVKMHPKLAALDRLSEMLRPKQTADAVPGGTVLAALNLVFVWPEQQDAGRAA
jgi:phage terminase small subunit